MIGLGDESCYGGKKKLWSLLWKDELWYVLFVVCDVSVCECVLVGYVLLLVCVMCCCWWIGLGVVLGGLFWSLHCGSVCPSSSVGRALAF